MNAHSQGDAVSGGSPVYDIANRQLKLALRCRLGTVSDEKEDGFTAIDAGGERMAS